MSEADKGKFEFVDVPDVQAPELLEAEPIDALFPKSSALESTHVDTGMQEPITGAWTHFYIRAAHGKPARYCTSSDGKTLTCGEPARGGLPPEAAGTPRLLGADDGAPELMLFAFDTGATSMGNVYRAGDGLRVMKAGEWFVDGGWARPDGSAQLLLRDGEKDRFKIARLAANATEAKLADLALPDWNGETIYAALVGDRVVWVDRNAVLKSKTLTATGEGPVQTIATLPGVIGGSLFRPSEHITACQTKSGVAISVPTEAGGAYRTLAVLSTDAGWGKAEVVEPGTMSCGDDAMYVVATTAFTTCKADGCKPQPLEKQKGAAVAVDGAVVRAHLRAGILRLTWERDGKTTATKLYDAQMKGTTLLGEAKLTYVNVVPRRGYAMLVGNIGDGQYFARVDGAGNAAPVSVKGD